jgi:hypothetical protein
VAAARRGIDDRGLEDDALRRLVEKALGHSGRHGICRLLDLEAHIRTNGRQEREVTEQLIRDTGYERASLGGLGSARVLEDFVPSVFAKVAPVFYRFAAPGDL